MDEPAEERTAADLFAGGVAPRDTRERILFTALDLFYEHGFHAVGLDRILAAVGVTKTTFYNHFESRDELVLEAIRRRDAWERQSFLDQVQQRARFDPKGTLLAMFDVLDAWFNHAEYKGCLFLAAAAEFPSRTHLAHRAAAAHYVASESLVREAAEAAGLRDPEGLARKWTLLLEGAVSYRMITGDDGAARTARAVAAAVLAEHEEQVDPESTGD